MRRFPFLRLLSLLPIFVLSSCGGSGGDDSSTASASAPIATSVAATAITENSATLNGTVNPNGADTQTWFEYGTDPGLRTPSSSPGQDAGNGLTAQPASTNLVGLTPGTTYYFRVCAESIEGYSEGQILTFATASPGSPPAVATTGATSVGATDATLNGNVNPNGLETDAWFEWGTSPNLVTFDASPVQVLGAGTTSQPVTKTLSGLSAGTTYYYRIAASNASGSAEGSISSFSTASSFFFGVVSTTPADNATDVPLGAVITVTFNLDLEIASLVGAITVESSLGNLPGAISYNYTTKTATFSPSAPFAPLAEHTVTVATKVKSADDVRLSEPYIFSFKTGSGF